MATTKQRQAVERIVENRGNVSKSMREVGYDADTAKNPKNLTESKGFKELCEELGLTDNLLVKALVEDINAKPGNRVNELRLAATITGRMTETPAGATVTNIIMMPGKQRLDEGPIEYNPDITEGHILET
jgi:hypothetical protein